MNLSHIPTLSTQTHAASSASLPPPTPEVHTLDELHREFLERESLENPDVVVPMRALRLTDVGTLAVPGLGAFAFTDWSKHQLSSIVGVRWDRWFARMNAEEQSTEVNKRLWSNGGSLRVRTSAHALVTNGTEGTLNALVSPTFTPLPDAQMLGLLAELLRTVEPSLRVLRHAFTDKTTTYVLGVGAPFRPGDDHDVGDIWGGLTVRNSGVGFAAAMILASFERLLCKNGMTAPVPGARLLRRAHRSFDLGKLRELLAERLRELPGKLGRAGEVLVAAHRERVDEARPAFQALLRLARMPLRLLPQLEAAYEAEPRLQGTRFGISQAATRAAQDLSPEERFELEQAAGDWIANPTRRH